MEKKIGVIVIGHLGVGKTALLNSIVEDIKKHDDVILIVSNASAQKETTSVIRNRKEPIELKVVEHIAYDNPKKKYKGHQRPYKFHK